MNWHQREVQDIYALRRRSFSSGKEQEGPRFLVFFRIDKILPLIGAGVKTS